MSNCPRCRALLTCSCQNSVATDGTRGCSHCIPAYQAQLNAIQNGTVVQGVAQYVQQLPKPQNNNNLPLYKLTQ